MEEKEIQCIEANASYMPPQADLTSMPSTRKVVWQERIHNFLWQWHVIVMSTGVCSSLLHDFPYQPDSDALKITALSLFLFNLVLFTVLCVWAIARCTMFPEDRALMFTDPATSLFIGFFANGAATLINSALSVNRDWGIGSTTFLYTLWGLWWFDSVLSCLIAFGLLYLMLGQNFDHLSKVLPVWMVPLMTLIAASASGGLFARSLLPHSHMLAILSVFVSVTMLAIGLSFTMMLTTAFLLRLYLHSALDARVVLTTFMTLTPLGQGGYSMLVNGQDIANLFVQHAAFGSVPPSCGNIIYSVCICGAYVLWSMGVAWIVISCFSIRCARKLPQFSLGHWCVVVPNGVFAALSLQFGVVFDSAFFCVFGAVWACVVFALWLFLFCRSVVAIWDGSMFIKPGATTAKPTAALIQGEVAEGKVVERVLPQTVVLPGLTPSGVESS